MSINATNNFLKLKKIINKLDIENNKEKYILNYKLFEDVKKFIIKKKLILYGGYAINLLLPKKYKFYKEYTLNDYDCFSKNAKEDAFELANYLEDKGYKYIEVKKAIHNNTFKVFAEFIQIIDITLINEEVYNKLYEVILQERKTKIYNYFKEKNIYIAPMLLLKRNLYFEMARPKGSYYRWDKIYKRIKILNKIDLLNIKKMKYDYFNIPENLSNIVKIYLKYIKSNEFPIIANFALKLYNKTDLYKNLNKNENYTMILSTNYKETTNELVKLLTKNLQSDRYTVSVLEIKLLPDILYNHNRIIIHDTLTNYNFTISTVINLQNECLSVKKIQGYTVGSIDTILYFYYSVYIIYLMYSEDKTIVDETLYYIKEFEKKLKNIDINERISVNCYGNNISLQDIIKKNWSKKNTLIKKK